AQSGQPAAVSTGAYAPVALVALGGVVVLWGVSLYQGRQLRRVERRAAERGTLAVRGGPERLAELRGPAPPSTAPPPRGSRRGLVAAAVGVVVVALAGVGAWWLWLRDDGGKASPASTPAPAASARPTGLGPDPETVVPRVLPVLPHEPSYYQVAILNGTSVNGAARRLIAPRVEGAGFGLGRVGDAPSNAQARSIVMFPPGRRVVALAVARDLNIHRVSPIDGVPEALTGPVDAVVIVGCDLAGG